jgi:hypothetical protein
MTREKQNLRDKYKLKLEKHLKELERCQEQKSIESCTECKEILICGLRDNYVLAVYESMNMGQGGGFEF